MQIIEEFGVESAEGLRRELLEEEWWMGPLPLFLRKNVILRGLWVREVQECDSKDFAGLGGWIHERA